MNKRASYDEAVEAVRVFRSMQYGLTSFARGLTGRSDVSVQVSKSSNGATDGKTIFFRPPMILGKNNSHTRALCDRRDENLQLLCSACQAREVVMSTIYHEIAHIAFDSFEPVSEIAKVEMLKRLTREHGKKKGRVLADRLEAAPPIAKVSYPALSRWINEFFPLIVNGLEDARVNLRMVQARSGIQVMLEAQIYRIFAEGIEVHGGEVQYWRERPLNLQMIIGIYLQAVGLPYEELLDAKVVADLQAPGLVALTDKTKDLAGVGDVFELAFDVLVAIRELGYCKQEYDETEEEEEDDPAQSPEEPEQADEPEEAGGNEADESEGDEVSGSPGDAEDGGSDSEALDSESTGESEPEGEGECGSEGEDRDGAPSGAGDLEDDGSSGLEEGAEGTPGGDATPEDDATASGETGDGSEDDASGGSDRSDGPEDTRNGSGSQPVDPESDGQSEGDAGQEVDPDGARGDGSGNPGSADPGADPEGEGVDDEGHSSGADVAGDGEGGEESSPSGAPSNAGSRPGQGGDASTHDGSASPAGYEGDDPDPANGWGDDDSADESAGQVPSPLDFGSAEDVEDALDGVLGHHNPEMEDDRAGVNLLKKAVEQSEFFDTPSMNVYSTNVVRRSDKQHDYSPWAPRYGSRFNAIKIEETLLSKALMHSRVVFSDNKRAKNVGNLKSGKVNAKVLGKRAFGNDERLFKKKTQPNKRDYFVVLGIDVSGSTQSGPGGDYRAEPAIVLERRAVMAQAEILNRLGIPFSIFAHSGIFKGGKDTGREMQLEIYEVKGPRDPWTDKERGNLASLQPSAFNLDGHTMEFYRKQLDASSATDKVLIYYTDGAMPMENFAEELVILKREINTCRQRGYSILAVGVGNDDPVKYGLDTVRVDTDADIVNVVKRLERRLAVV